MPNKWVEHVKRYSKNNNLSYGCAVSDPNCKASYKFNKDKDKIFKMNDRINADIDKTSDYISTLKPINRKTNFRVNPRKNPNPQRYIKAR